MVGERNLLGTNNTQGFGSKYLGRDLIWPTHGHDAEDTSLGQIELTERDSPQRFDVVIPGVVLVVDVVGLPLRLLVEAPRVVLVQLEKAF